ncbi:MAG: hypothetical protein KZQ94_05750 [Candidatus Thiodiazotropha sp. (ex Troendleina suluensis)]|nr:hypothetical protein [Candidatus Thiodiazotropha sp. (ex Troendleina suluensis)]
MPLLLYPDKESAVDTKSADSVTAFFHGSSHYSSDAGCHTQLLQLSQYKFKVFPDSGYFWGWGGRASGYPIM